MIIDLRYHIASLAAVFLALGVGILIGGTMLKTDALVESRGQIAERLEKQLAQLRRENEAIQAQVNCFQIKSDQQKDFAGQILPFLVKGRLEGRRVAIIETGGNGFPGDLIATLELAGAKVQSVTTINGGAGEREGNEAPEEKPGGKNSGAGQLNSRLAGEIGRCLTTGGSQAVLNDLAEANVFKLSGEYGVPLDAVVLIGGSRERERAKPQAIDLPLIDYFQAGKIPVYGAEETDVPYSYMKHYQKKGISTVDNIDTVPGQVALVLAMAGRPGHYGIKPTAQRMLPSLDGAEGSVHAGS
ncbi:MAG: copper transporter [Armatimonadetes bacterium]|nr:copper transporter [Armatimonadota bacterium]